MIQEQTGGKTQVASVVSAALILVVLLWIGPFFETLPRAVLAGIIIVALKTTLWQIKDLKRFSKEGVLEATVWICTFLAVSIIDIDVGLLCGIIISLLSLYIKGWKSYSCILGVVPDTDIYVDVKTHRAAVEVPNTKVFRYCGPINFASRAGFKKALMSKIGVDHRVIKRALICDFNEARNLTVSILELDGVKKLSYSLNRSKLSLKI
jgi:solute carrier family 26 protein